MVILLPNNTKAVIFDLDGTLLDSSEVYYVATEHIFVNKDKEFGIQLGKSIERYGLTKSAQLMGVSKDELKRWLTIWIEVQEDNTHIFSSTIPLLDNLSNSGLIFAINTNRPQPLDEVRNTLKRHSIDHMFPVIQTALTTGTRKPDPKGIQLILSEFGISPKDCYFVGDSFVDIMAGNKAGVNTIAVTTGVYCKDELEEYSPDYIVDDISLIENIVLNKK